MNILCDDPYKAGPWNGYRSCRFDDADPFGHSIANKLLPNYMATRKGNCVSMPSLLIILGQKLGLDVTASCAPCHIFVKYRDDAGNRFNLEATNDAGIVEDWTLRANLPMTPESLANGIYLQPASKRETVTIMMEPLMQFYSQSSQPERHIACAGLALAYYPKNVQAMTHIGEAFGKVLQHLYLNKYPAPKDIPVERRPYFEYLWLNTHGWFYRAEILGWRKMDDATKAAHLERLETYKREHARDPAN